MNDSDLHALIAAMRIELVENRAELARLRADVERLTQVVGELVAPQTIRIAEHQKAPEQHVDLDQVAAMLHISPRSLERYRTQMPPPVRKGHKGRRALWRWHELRPFLEETFEMNLPENFPGQAG